MRDLALYKYGNQAGLVIPPFVHFIICCSQCAEFYLHPMYNYVDVQRPAVAGEKCEFCKMERVIESEANNELPILQL